MLLTPAFNPSASVDGRAAPASTDTDGNAETLTQKFESLLDNLQETESFLSSSEGMSARKEEINQRDNDLTLRMQVIMCQFTHVDLFSLALNLHGTGSCGI